MGLCVTPSRAPRVSTPHYSSGLLIEKNDAYTKVFSRTGLALMWDREDSLMVGAGTQGSTGAGGAARSLCLAAGGGRPRSGRQGPGHTTHWRRGPWGGVGGCAPTLVLSSPQPSC